MNNIETFSTNMVKLSSGEGKRYFYRCKDKDRTIRCLDTTERSKLDEYNSCSANKIGYKRMSFAGIMKMFNRYTNDAFYSGNYQGMDMLSSGLDCLHDRIHDASQGISFIQKLAQRIKNVASGHGFRTNIQVIDKAYDNIGDKLSSVSGYEIRNMQSRANIHHRKSCELMGLDPKSISHSDINKEVSSFIDKYRWTTLEDEIEMEDLEESSLDENEHTPFDDDDYFDEDLVTSLMMNQSEYNKEVSSLKSCLVLGSLNDTYRMLDNQ